MVDDGFGTDGAGGFGMFQEKDIAVWIVDGNSLSRLGLRQLFADSAFRVEAEHSSTEELFDAEFQPADPSIILVDLPDNFREPTTELLRLRRAYPTVRLVVFSYCEDPKYLMACIAAEIDGYLLKSVSAPVLIGLLHLVALGERIYPPHLVDWYLESVNFVPRKVNFVVDESVNLSKREVEILGCLAKGNSNKQIAKFLKISDATVKIHVKNLLRKISVTNRTEAAVWALTTGFIEISRGVDRQSQPDQRTGGEVVAGDAIDVNAELETAE